jgi:hypothetical protein
MPTKQQAVAIDRLEILIGIHPFWFGQKRKQDRTKVNTEQTMYFNGF